MKRIAILLLFIICVITGCSQPMVSGELKPPSAELTIDGIDVPHLLGSYSWTGKGRGVNSDSPFPPQIVKDTASFAAKPGAKLLIRFDDRPKSVSAALWQDDKQTTVPLNDYAISLPKEAGIYVYSFHAEWKEGHAIYVCKIEIQAAQTAK